jgi:alkylation response protein AidB-like acyl-CoA dehydrogenase
MAVSIELAKNTLYKAAWLHSVGKPDGVVSGAAGQAASNAYIQVTTEGMGVFGGYSQVTDSNIQRHLRDASAWMSLSGAMGKSLIGRALGLPKSY